MMENMVGKLIVLEFKKADGRVIRTIFRVLGVKDGFVEVESPTKRQRSMIALSSVTEAIELRPDEIRRDKVTTL